MKIIEPNLYIYIDIYIQWSIDIWVRSNSWSYHFGRNQLIWQKSTILTGTFGSGQNWKWQKSIQLGWVKRVNHFKATLQLFLDLIKVEPAPRVGLKNLPTLDNNKLWFLEGDNPPSKNAGRLTPVACSKDYTHLQAYTLAASSSTWAY